MSVKEAYELARYAYGEGYEKDGKFKYISEPVEMDEDERREILESLFDAILDDYDDFNSLEKVLLSMKMNRKG